MDALVGKFELMPIGDELGATEGSIGIEEGNHDGDANVSWLGSWVGAFEGESVGSGVGSGVSSRVGSGVADVVG